MKGKGGGQGEVNDTKGCQGFIGMVGVVRGHRSLIFFNRELRDEISNVVEIFLRGMIVMIRDRKDDDQKKIYMHQFKSIFNIYVFNIALDFVNIIIFTQCIY